jgi:hypothetical protein
LNAFSNELRLLWTLLLNGGVFAAAYCLARRRGTGGVVAAICDAFGLYFLTQYAAVALPGILGVFNAWTMSLVAALAAAAMWIAAHRGTGGPPMSSPRGGGSSGSLALFGLVARLRDRHPEVLRRILPRTRRAHRSFGVPQDDDGPLYQAEKGSKTTTFSKSPGAMNRAQATRGAGQIPITARSISWTLDHLALLFCALFAAGYLAAHAWSQRLIPPIATDSLVYHLPTAVQWMQTHRLGIYPTWYWNPAASWSPGTGSIFMAWWMAPAGNDVFVRYVQLPPLLFIFFLVVRCCRLMDCSRAVSGLVAIGATLSRPLFSEAIFPKDDLYVTAFVAAAVLALSGESIGDLANRATGGPTLDLQSGHGRAAHATINPLRVGVALGLVLASKYTVLLVCPIFLFLIDSPFRARWGWRQWSIAAAIISLLAGPWYLRNLILTRNPLYPVDIHLPGLTLPGLFTTERDQQLRTAGGVWHMLADTYHSLPKALIVLLMAGIGAACILRPRAILRQPLPRACVIGTIFTLILFLITSPHHEVRYLFPLIVLLFAATGLALGAVARFSRGYFSIAAAIVIAAASTITSFDRDLIGAVATRAGIAIIIAAAGVALVLLQTRLLRLSRTRLAMCAVCAAVAFLLAVYVQWRAYVEGYRDSRMLAWSQPNGYPRQAGIWKWVDENTPSDATIAYANTFFVYPYYGFDLSRRVGYAPVRKGLHDFLHFPRMGQRVPGDLLVRRMTEVMNADADADTWLQNLRAMKAGYLVVMKHDPDNPDLSADPPELKMAQSRPEMFVPVKEDEAGVVFRVVAGH